MMGLFGDPLMIKILSLCVTGMSNTYTICNLISPHSSVDDLNGTITILSSSLPSGAVLLSVILIIRVEKCVTEDHVHMQMSYANCNVTIIVVCDILYAIHYIMKAICMYDSGLPDLIQDCLI